MSSNRTERLSVLDRLKNYLSRVIAPNVGDKKTEQWEIVTIEPLKDGLTTTYQVTGYSSTTEEAPEFSKTVDHVSINNSFIEVLEPLRLDGGVSFEYYWSLDEASVDFYQ